MRRSFLFLQGVNTPFFARLADRLAADGHRVSRINFNVGDAVYWGRRDAWSFKQPLENLPGFLDEALVAAAATDMVLFGDMRPVHRPAITLATREGIRSHVFEEGYFRPYWITLERGGVNANSPLPRDAGWYRATGPQVPAAAAESNFSSTLSPRALHDIAYQLCNLGNGLLYPHYRSHQLVTPRREYAGLARRLALRDLHARRERPIIESLIAGRTPYFFVPLQLDGDAQIREHSIYGGMAPFIADVMQSFARHAQTTTRLVFKIHPLDPDSRDRMTVIRQHEREFDLANRVDCLETGDLAVLLPCARGMVTINSTAGLAALGAGCPTIAMSSAIYSLPGLTFQGGLDEFWRGGVAPEADLYRHFRNIVMYATQINGGFYSARGITLAVERSARALVTDRSALESLL